MSAKLFLVVEKCQLKRTFCFQENEVLALFQFQNTGKKSYFYFNFNQLFVYIIYLVL